MKHDQLLLNFAASVKNMIFVCYFAV